MAVHLTMASESGSDSRMLLKSGQFATWFELLSFFKNYSKTPHWQISRDLLLFSVIRFWHVSYVKSLTIHTEGNKTMVDFHCWSIKWEIEVNCKKKIWLISFWKKEKIFQCFFSFQSFLACQCNVLGLAYQNVCAKRNALLR